MSDHTPLWDDDLIQFARLICEIDATQFDLDRYALCESMDLDRKDLDSLFKRADVIFERTKERLAEESS